jgi:hypothetical protein
MLLLIPGMVLAALTAEAPQGQMPPERPRASMECVAFESPAQLPRETTFRVGLPHGLELRVDFQISVGPASEPDVDYVWLVSPPLQTAPQRVIGEAYNVTAEQSAAEPRNLRFVVTREDYRTVQQLLDRNPSPDRYNAELNRLKRFR